VLLAPAAAAPAGLAPNGAASTPTAAGATDQRACVVLLHGLGRSYRSMNRIADAATAAGYTVVNIDYPSRSQPIETLAVDAVPRGLDGCRRAGATPVHFITHSMGGILLRQYLNERSLPDLGRVVMMGPPNQGSELADALRNETSYQYYNGPAGQQLGTGPDGIAARLGPVNFSLGVIAGNQQTVVDAVLASHIPGEHDGKVAVERARVDGMRDFIVLPANHTFIVTDPDAIAQALHFLRHEQFRH
jgi:triacylglycerol lipase